VQGSGAVGALALRIVREVYIAGLDRSFAHLLSV
jgi:hypothetical protein